MSPERYQPPAKLACVVVGFLRYPFMIEWPRIMISPVVSPSAGTRANVSGSATMTSSTDRLGTPWRAMIRARSPASSASHSLCQAQVVAGP